MAITVEEKLQHAVSHLERALEGIGHPRLTGEVTPQTIAEVVYAAGYLHDAIKALPGEIAGMIASSLEDAGNAEVP